MFGSAICAYPLHNLRAFAPPREIYLGNMSYALTISLLGSRTRMGRGKRIFTGRQGCVFYQMVMPSKREPSLTPVPTPPSNDRRNQRSLGDGSLDVGRAARSPRLLGTLWWSEKSGGLFHRETRKAAPKWLGLTKSEWMFFVGVASVAFVAGLAVLRLAPGLLPI